MNEQIKNGDEVDTSEMWLLTDIESAVNAVKKNGYESFRDTNLSAIGIDIDDLRDKMNKEGFLENDHLLFYDPKRFESKTINAESKELDQKIQEGWKEIGKRSGEYATIIKKMEEEK